MSQRSFGAVWPWAFTEFTAKSIRSVNNDHSKRITSSTRPSVQATSIRAPLLRSVPSSTYRINVGYRSIDFYPALDCHEHGKYLLPARDTRKASILLSVVVASTQMSLSSFGRQSVTYNYNTTRID